MIFGQDVGWAHQCNRLLPVALVVPLTILSFRAQVHQQTVVSSHQRFRYLCSKQVRKPATISLLRAPADFFKQSSGPQGPSEAARPKLLCSKELLHSVFLFSTICIPFRDKLHSDTSQRGKARFPPSAASTDLLVHFIASSSWNNPAKVCTKEQIQVVAVITGNLPFAPI